MGLKQLGITMEEVKAENKQYSEQWYSVMVHYKGIVHMT